VKTILVLGASVSQVPAIRAARSIGLRVVAIDGDPHAVGFALADVAELVDFSDVPAVLDVARSHRIDGVVAISSDRAVGVAAAVADELALAGIGIQVGRAMTDKAEMRKRLAAAGLPQPPFAVAGTGDEAAVIESVGAPAVVKPVDSGGQRGLFVVESAEELRRLLPATLSFSRSKRAIVERYVFGSELNVMAVVADGTPHVLTISDRLRPAGPGFGVGWIHLYPSLLPDEVVQRAGAVAEEAIRALGLRSGVAFPQLLVADGEVFVVEVAARVAAGQMADVVRHGVGVDVIEIALRQAMGEPVDPKLLRPRFVRPLAVRFLTASPGPLPTGRLCAVRGLDRVRRAPGVVDAGLYLQLGEMIRPVQVDADRRGYVIATADDPTRALELADEAIRLLEVDVDPDPGPGKR
jgi:biotin carboxylase